MKKYIAGFLMSFILCSCSGGGSDDTPPQPEQPTNKEPTSPLLLEPTNNKLCIDNTVAFKWDVATDPEKDKITYQIQISKDNQFTKIEETSSTESTSKSIALEKGIAKEQARALLPEGLTTSRLYMNGNIRSWIFYLKQRLDPSTQKEHRVIAEQILSELRLVAPMTMAAFFTSPGFHAPSADSNFFIISAELTSPTTTRNALFGR